MIKKTYFILFLFFIFGLPLCSNALTVSPKKIEISGDPGETITKDIILANQKEVVQTYNVSFENFKPKGNSGIPEFVGSDYGLATWIRVPEESVTLPGEETILPFSVDIPETAIPGGYFSAVFFESRLSENDEGSLVAEKVGILVFLTVNGAIEEDSRIVSFTTKNNTRITTDFPSVFDYYLENKGGDRITPEGTIRIVNVFGSSIQEINANREQGSVLPGSSRMFTVGNTIEEENISSLESQKNFFTTLSSQIKNFRFGLYTAKIELDLSKDSLIPKQSEYVFFVFPWQIIFCFLVVGITLYKIVYWGIRRYNTKIVSLHQLHNNTIKK